MSETNSAAIFGLADGMTAFLGILAALIVAHDSAHAVWHSALGVGLAELAGMSLGQYWSDPAAGKLAAGWCGITSAAACIVPAIPFVLDPGSPVAVAASVALIAAGAGIVCALRPERGWQAIARTYGLLALVAVMTGISGLI